MTWFLRHRFVSLVALLAVLAGPVAAQAPSVGSSVANPEVLGRLFAAACMQSPTAEEAQDMLAGAGMVPNPETGTYFHQVFDMSVNPSGAACSMVFLGDDPASIPSLFRESARALAGDLVRDIEIEQLDGHADLYYRASVGVRW